MFTNSQAHKYTRRFIHNNPKPETTAVSIKTTDKLTMIYSCKGTPPRRPMQQYGRMFQVMFSERSQTHKNTYFMILFIGSAKRQKQVYIVGSQETVTFGGLSTGRGQKGLVGRVAMARILLMDLPMCKKPWTSPLKMGGLSVCPFDLNCSQSTKSEIRRGFLVCLLWTGWQPGGGEGD